MTNETTARGFAKAQLATPAAEALATLDEAGARGLELIAAWVAAKNAAAIAEVAERGAGRARKDAKRGLNVLKARGVELPSRQRVARLGADTAATDTTTEQAWLLPPDANGTILLALGRHQAARRGMVAFVYLHDGLGVQRIDIRELSQSQLLETLAKSAAGESIKAVSVPSAWARWRVARALEAQRERRIPDPLGLTTAGPLLQPVPSSEPPHPFDEEGLELGDEDASELCARSAELHRLPEFRGWLPVRASIEELLQHLGQDMQPGDEQKEELMKQRLAEQVRAATDRYFTPERREGLVRSLKDAGLAVLSRAGEAKALEVAALIKAIASCGLITDPPADVPFLRAFFEKGLSAVAQRSGGRLQIPMRAATAPATSAGEVAGDAPATPPPEAAKEASVAAASEPIVEAGAAPISGAPPATDSLDSAWEKE